MNHRNSLGKNARELWHLVLQLLRKDPAPFVVKPLAGLSCTLRGAGALELGREKPIEWGCFHRVFRAFRCP
jgi:hypothetical protein